MSASSTVLYRRADSGDPHAICVLGQVVNGLHHAAWPDLFTGAADPSRDAAHWRASIDGPQAATFVATVDDAVVGFVTAAWVDETNPLIQPNRIARVNTLCVEPSWQRRGIGRALMDQAERWAADAGALEVRLNVWSFNETARAVYATLGYDERSVLLGKRLSHSS